MKTSDFHIYSNTGPNGKRIHGDFTYRCIRFSFTLNQQKDKEYRGQINVISPQTGRNMEFYVKHPYAKDQSLKRQKVKYREISTKTSNTSIIRDYIQARVETIYADNALEFAKLLEKEVTPDTVYPELCGTLYGTDYINFRFAKNNTEETMKKKKAKLTCLLAALPYKPMKMITEAEAAETTANWPIIDRKLLGDFWDYCILKHYCTGNNPVTIPASAGLSPTANQNKLQKLTHVPKHNLDILNKKLLDIHGGPECGVALMESNISSKEACSLCWRDIFWSTDDPAYAIIRLERQEILCAVHNYDRPALPITAQTMFSRRKDLLERFSEEELMDMPVVSTKTNPAKPMDASALVQVSKDYLIDSGIKENKLLQSKESRGDPVSARILSETYKSILIKDCGIKEGAGTYKFLLGHAIHNDVTSSNYLSFTDPMGSLRLYKYLKAASFEREYTNQLSQKTTETADIFHILPKSNTRCAGVIADVILMPGEELRVETDTAMTGRFEAFIVPELMQREASAGTES